MFRDWLKQRLRLAGKTTQDLAEAISRDRAVVSRIMNGHQELALSQANAFAAVLGVAPAEILRAAGLADNQTARQLMPGFAESDAAAWIAQGAEDRQVPSMAAALGQRPGVDVWQVRSAALALMGYMPGDYMLVDTNQSERARAGDVVVAQVYDNARGTATTLLRRFEPPVLVAASVDPAERRVYVVDGVNTVIKGKIVASWRV